MGRLKKMIDLNNKFSKNKHSGPGQAPYGNQAWGNCLLMPLENSPTDDS